MNLMGSVFILMFLLAAGLGISDAYERIKYPDPRSAAQRRAMRENCRAKGL